MRITGDGAVFIGATISSSGEFFGVIRPSVAYTAGEQPIASFGGSVDNIGFVKIQNINNSVGSGAPSAGIDFDVSDGHHGTNRLRTLFFLRKTTSAGGGGDTFMLSPKDIKIYTFTSGSLTGSSGAYKSSQAYASTTPLIYFGSASVGINTVSPLYWLDINGTFRATTSVSSSLLNIDNIKIDGSVIDTLTGSIRISTGNPSTAVIQLGNAFDE
jgi:hypothetical protein